MTKVRLDTYKSKIDIGASKITQVIWYFSNIIFFKNPIPFPSTLKSIILRLFGAKVGKGVILKPCINVKFPWKLTIGDYCWIGENVWIDNLEQAIIGKHCCLSQGAMLLTGSHNAMKSSFDYDALPITIEDGVWIGAAAIVCPGVVCKTHAVLSVASVATKDLESYSVYKGNPAIKVTDRIIY